MKRATAVVGLGSNLAHPRQQLARAISELQRLPATRVVRVSPNYVSAPVDCSAPQPDYVNSVVQISTGLTPRALLRHLQRLESRHRRVRGRGAPRNQPRTLDLDLLLYGRRRISQPMLTVPHPRLHARAFVLRPLLDVAPHARIPGRGPARQFLPGVRDQRIARTRAHRIT